MKSRARIFCLVLADVVGAALCWLLVLWAYKALGFAHYHIHNYLSIWPLFVVYGLAIFYQNLYKLRSTYPLRVSDCVEEFKGLCLAALFAHGMVMVYLGFVHDPGRVSRFALLVSCALTMLAAQPMRVFARRLIRRLDPSTPPEPSQMSLHSWRDPEDKVETFSTGLIKYSEATAIFTVGLSAKSEGDMTIAGTKGYIYVPSPWWKTEYFELRNDMGQTTRRVFCPFVGDGLRYELADFVNAISGGLKPSTWSVEDSLALLKLLIDARSR